MLHELVLLHAENKDIRAANKVLSKCRRAKKTQLRQGKLFSFQEAEDWIAKREVNTQFNAETSRSGSHTTLFKLCICCCRACGNTDHNTQTCDTIVIVSEQENSE